ncbi:hypothetical protein ACHAXT_000458 [Thalassiosira profunda]
MNGNAVEADEAEAAPVSVLSAASASKDGDIWDEQCTDEGAAALPQHAPLPELASVAKDTDEDEDDERWIAHLTTHAFRNWRWLHLFYLSLLSTLGVTVRAFTGRFFGGDCEADAEDHPIDDWLWPLSHKICVTASGQTRQHGGALFIDLPANMLGSFIMGFMTGHRAGEWPALPFLSHDHPLQGHEGLHVGIRTAVCGCLTTFSSWNAQMVLMMDGTANPFLGPQVVAALFGYILGLQVALVSYRAGRTLSAWCHLRRNPHLFFSDRSKKAMRRRCHHEHWWWIAPVAVLVLIGTIFALYVCGDVVWGISYYRELWIACLVAPVGTIFRWKLSTLNGKISYRNLTWFPAGTFLANLLGSIVAAGLMAWAIIAEDDEVGGYWKVPGLKALSLGVAGSLSTVSTFVKECVDICEKHPAFDKKVFLYSHGTMLICCFVGLMVYSPIVRNGL